MYISFIHPLFDYFKTLKRQEFVYEWIIPIVIGIIFYLCLLGSIHSDIIKEFNGYIINFIAILIGFSITCVVILVGSESQNIKDLKEKDSERKLNNKPVRLYQLILICYIYSIIIEIFTLVYVLMVILLVDPFINNQPSMTYKYFTIGTFILLLHIILLTIRNITNFYFSFWTVKKMKILEEYPAN